MIPPIAVLRYADGRVEARRGLVGTVAKLACGTFKRACSLRARGDDGGRETDDLVLLYDEVTS